MKTRTRDDQHKCPAPPRMQKPNTTIIKKKLYLIRKMISKLKKKNFPLVCRACRDESIDIQHNEI